MPLPHQGGVQSWILVITELHRYQGVGYKSDIVVISGDNDKYPGDTVFIANTIVIVTVITVYISTAENKQTSFFCSESIAKLFLVFNAHFRSNFYPVFWQIY